MFESAELRHEIDKATYDAAVPRLREGLLEAQFDLLQQKKQSVVLIIGGVDGAGKGETVNLLNEWMDPRHIQTHAMGPANDEERARPPMWRFWRALPPKGKIGIFFGSWYTDPIVRRAMGVSRGAELERSIAGIVRFERMLASEGALILKFWLHLSREAQERRLELLESSPKTRWRVTPSDWEHFRLYDRFRKISEKTLRATSTGEAPWHVVEGTDARYRSLTVATTIEAAVRARLDDDAPPPNDVAGAQPTPAIDGVHVLSRLDLARSLPKETYARKLEKYQRKLNLLSRHDDFKKVSAALVFEGADAAGKGGAIRRVTSALDARQYSVVPIAAPTDEERAQPYLWRFWRHLPGRGSLTIFDRSWYGRVLVERVEGFADAGDWLRAYSEINDFEEQLAAHRTVVVKFWLQISTDEQLRRFEERGETGFKRYKITPEDWRNREKAGAYERAVCDMIDRTSTAAAPWTLIEANDKYHARIKVLSTLCDSLEEAVESVR